MDYKSYFKGVGWHISSTDFQFEAALANTMTSKRGNHANHINQENQACPDPSVVQTFVREFIVCTHN
jgi:hypothetical protein